MTNYMLEQVELLLEACDAHRIQPDLELEEIRLFLKEFREEPRGKGAELARTRTRAFELGTGLLAVAREAERQSWTQEQKDAWAAVAEAGMIAELQQRFAGLDAELNAQLEAERNIKTSWAQIIEKRRAAAQGQSRP
jgi:hypothetical protein